MISGRKLFTFERASTMLLILNLAGTVWYLFMASRGGWKMPGEQAQGIDVTTGEPFIWATGVFPIYALFLLINVTWAALILRQRQWRSGRFWLATSAFWFVAVWIDFAHH